MWRTWPRVGEEIAHGYRRLAWFLMGKTASAEDKGSVGQNMDEYGGSGCQGQSVRVGDPAVWVQMAQIHPSPARPQVSAVQATRPLHGERKGGID